jgi:hypothetical protein
MTEQEIRDDERRKIVESIRSRVAARRADHATYPHPHNEQNTEVIAGVADSIERRRL